MSDQGAEMFFATGDVFTGVCKFMHPEGTGAGVAKGNGAGLFVWQAICCDQCTLPCVIPCICTRST